MKRSESELAGFTARDLRSLDPVPASPDRAISASLLKLAETMGGLDPRPPVSPVVIGGLVQVTEFVSLVLTGLVAVAAFGPADRVWLGLGCVVVVVWSTLLVAIFGTMRTVRIAAIRLPFRTLPRLLAILAVPLLGTAALGPRLAMGSDRTVALAWAGLAAVAIVAVRIAAYAIVRRLTQQGRLERRTVIVGGGPAGEELLQALNRHPDSDLKIYGVFDDRNDARSPMVVAGYPKLGTVSDLVTFARRTRIDLVIFTLPITAEERLLTMLRKLWVLPIDIRLAAHRNKLRLRPRSYSYIGGVPVLDVFDKPIADWDIVAKAIFDRVIGTLALVILSPVMLLTALAVKLDSRGPVFFKQMRHGFNNETVEVYKFRSMYADRLDPEAAKPVTRNDNRVTRVGRFIRKTSLDELPQLLNVVFKGNLSLVGPRPHAVHAHLANRAYDEVVDGYFARHRVKPGMTGWAQVKGWRGETDTPEKIQKRVECDLDYIENWSIFFDLYILAITPFALTKTENAY